MFRDTNLENFDFDIIRHISRCLDVRDLENLLIAIPGWRETIETEMKQRRVRGITWLDEEMCRLLFRPWFQVCIENFDQVVEYYTNQRELIVPDRPMGSVGKLNIIFLYHELNTENADFWNNMFDLFDETPNLLYHLRKRIHRVRMISMNLPSMVFELTSNESEITSQCRMKFSAFSELFLSRIAPFDVFFYFVDYSKPVVDVLQFLRRFLSSRRTLIISVIRDPKDSTMRNMGYLTELLSKIGGFVESDLKISRIQWRLWCVCRDSNDKPNFREMLEWFSDRWNNN